MNSRSREIWEDVKRNSALLDSCTSHDFSIDMNPERVIGKRWRCTNCGGHVDHVCKNWYESGLKHGKSEVSNETPKQ